MVANIVWGHFQDLNPLMTPHAMLNWDNTPWILLEVVNSQAFRVLQEWGALDWTYLVSPGMAVVCSKHQLDTMEGLEEFIKTLHGLQQPVPPHQVT